MECGVMGSEQRRKALRMLYRKYRLDILSEKEFGLEGTEGMEDR